MAEVFSVIMPAFNAEKTIRESIDSVLSQTFTDFKIYVVDDASNDDTANVILGYADERVVYIRNEINLGVSRSRNAAIEIAKGKYISFLDSDDLWLPEKLEKQYSLLQSGKNVVCSGYTVFSCEGKGKTIIPDLLISYSDMLKSNRIGNLTGAYNAELLGKFFQQDLGHEDYIMWLDILSSSECCHCVQQELALYRKTNNSLSSNKIKAMSWQWNIYRRVLKLPLLNSFYYFIFYVFNAAMKR